MKQQCCPWLSIPLLSCFVVLILVSCVRNNPAQNPLEIASAVATSQTSLLITFSKAVGASAEVPENYKLNGSDKSSLKVLSSYLSDDGFSVVLGTELQQQIKYNIEIKNITLASGGKPNAITALSAFGGSGEIAPIVASAIALNNTSVLISFADPATGTPVAMGPSAINRKYYTIRNPDLGIAEIKFASPTDQTRVILTTGKMRDQIYTVKVTNAVTAVDNKLIDPFLNTASFEGIAVKDILPPGLKNVYATSNTKVIVQFNEPVNDNMSDPSHYTIKDAGGNDLQVVEVILDEFSTQATLTTLPMTPKVTYTLTATNLTDLKNNVVATRRATFIGLSGNPSDDILPPRLMSATSTSNNSVVVTFSEPVAGGTESAENPAHYSIVSSDSLDGDLSPQGIIVVKGAVLSANKRSVTLSTLSQSEVEYTLKVASVQDLAGNQIAPPDLLNPFHAKFFGTGPSGTALDSDGDGLTDAEEQRGWTITIKLANGEVSKREVTSDPGDPSLPDTDPVNVAARDTDQDEILDGDEKHYGVDPRNPDSDDDTLSDWQELSRVYSDPANQDTDGDGMTDGLEHGFFLTSALLEDTDGDQFPDNDEVVTDNRNARIADLPKIDIGVGDVDLRLDVRFEEQNSRGTTTLENKTISSTLAQASSNTFSSETSSTLEWFVNGGIEVCVAGGCEDGKPGGAKFSVQGGVSGSATNTFSNESARETQQEYATSLSTDEEVSAESTVVRTVEGATMAVEVNIKNTSNVAFTISDIEITALLQDTRDPTVFVPVATLFSASDAPISIGPLTPERGPFRFVANDAFPSLVESLMRNPRGLFFKIANYTIEDEFGRKFAFVEQDVNDRTAFLEINYAGNLPQEKYQVATNAEFNDAGKPAGITLKKVMEDILGLKLLTQAADDALIAKFNSGTLSTAEATLFNNSYSLRRVGSIDVLYRVRSVSKATTDVNRNWWVITPQGMITPVGSIPGRDFDSYKVFSDQDFALKFVQDADADALEAGFEALYRSLDSDKDTDDDGIADGDEVYGPFVNSARRGWTIQLEDGRDAYKTFPNPGRADTDLDGLNDCQELRAQTSCSAITVYQTADAVPTLASRATNGVNNAVLTTVTLAKVIDPSNPDTDGDGLSDAQEIAGFRYTGLTGVTVTLTPLTIPATPYTTNPLSKDTDGDGLDDFQEIRLGTNPTAADGDAVRDDDGDGLVNLQETTLRFVPVRTSAGSFNLPVNSDPKDADSDDDGLSDWEEYYGCRDRNKDFACDSDVRFPPTDARRTDSDVDVLSDFQEVEGANFAGDPENPLRVTSPVDFDTDRDRVWDSTEVQIPWTVRVAGKAARTVYSDPLSADRDGDGLSDYFEVTGCIDNNVDSVCDLSGVPVTPTDANKADTDEDGALDGLEFSAGRLTNALVPDHKVTVFYHTFSVAKNLDSATADADCDAGTDTGDFFFRFEVGIPGASEIVRTEVLSSSSVNIPLCTLGATQSFCKNNSGTPIFIQLGAPSTVIFDATDNNSRSFAVPFTDLFTVQGLVQELDGGADLSYDFGGFGSTNGVYQGSNLSKGSFNITINTPPRASGNRVCPVEITAQVKVE